MFDHDTTWKSRSATGGFAGGRLRWAALPWPVVYWRAGGARPEGAIPLFVVGLATLFVALASGFTSQRELPQESAGD